MGGAARLSAGIWREVANVVDPQSATTEATSETGADAGQERQPTSDEHPDSAAHHVAEGAMLVPIDTWTRVLDQLSNLHQAGQDLAEARERAARAETEALFLREQLADLRSGPQRPQPAAAPDTGGTRARAAGANVVRAGRRVTTWFIPRKDAPSKEDT
ncbi:MAG: hypothetical protein ACC660_08380 [Acidimicrobiales bacterium]